MSEVCYQDCAVRSVMSGVLFHGWAGMSVLSELFCQECVVCCQESVQGLQACCHDCPVMIVLSVVLCQVFDVRNLLP